MEGGALGRRGSALSRKLLVLGAVEDRRVLEDDDEEPESDTFLKTGAKYSGLKAAVEIGGRDNGGGSGKNFGGAESEGGRECNEEDVSDILIGVLVPKEEGGKNVLNDLLMAGGFSDPFPLSDFTVKEFEEVLCDTPLNAEVEVVPSETNTQVLPLLGHS